MELEQLHACPACGHTRFRRYKRIAEWRIVQCHRCQLAFLNPRPSTAEQKRIYSIYEGYPPLPTDPIEQRRLIDVENYRVAPLTEVRLPGALLDVGCGSGFFMALARERGWTVMGTEIASHCVAYARERLGLDIFEGDLTELDPARRFDVIAINHVLEHVADPIVQITAAQARLNDDGLLVVSVPNHRSFDAWRKGLEWEGWALPWHFYHFTPATLRGLLERCGLRVIRTDYGLSDEFNKPWVIRLRRRLSMETQRRIFSGTNLTMYARIDRARTAQ